MKKEMFDSIFEDCTRLGTKIPKEEYLAKGNHIVIDQGTKTIAGYTNIEEGLYEDVPALIFGDHTRIVKYVDKPFFLGADGVKLLKSKREDANYKYLYYALKNAKIPNTGYNRHFKWLKEVKIPYPDLFEQQRVVEVLDSISNIVEKRKYEFAYLDNLIKARFVEMFGDEAKFEKRQFHLSVKEMFIGPFGSSLKNESFVSKEDAYCMVYEQKHAIKKSMKVDTRFVNKEKFLELQRFTVEQGDIIVSCRGTIGESYIIPQGSPLGIMHPSIMKIRVKKEMYNLVFLDFLLQRVFKEVNTNANGSGVKMSITAKKLGQEYLILPSLELQNQFADFVTQVDKSKVVVQKALDEAQLLFDSLLQQYFG